MRINRFLASAGVGSRRACEELVRSGRVQINGNTIDNLATRVAIDDIVMCDGAVVKPTERKVYLVLNKPSGTISSNRDEEGRPIAADLLRQLYGGRLFSIGRLDFLSTGLLLFTNDGDLCNRLTHPSAGIEREYTVETRRPIPNELLDSFVSGVRVDGTLYRARRYQINTDRRCTIVLSEGKNREIRNVFSHCKVTISRIHRVRYGPIRLGRLPAGQARFLTEKERDDLLSLVKNGGQNDRRNRRSGRNRQK